MFIFFDAIYVVYPILDQYLLLFKLEIFFPATQFSIHKKRLKRITVIYRLNIKSTFESIIIFTFKTGHASECRQISPPHEGETETGLVQGRRLAHAWSSKVRFRPSWTG